MKESSLKVDGLFLPLTSPVPVTFTRFLACTFRRVWSNIFPDNANTIFADNARKIMCRGGTFWKNHIFRKFEENIIFPCIFKERSSFIFRLTCKIIFSGKRNIIFPDNTRKIIFQRNFFGKTIFSGRLEKENMVFRAAFC